MVEITRVVAYFNYFRIKSKLIAYSCLLYEKYLAVYELMLWFSSDGPAIGQASKFDFKTMTWNWNDSSIAG